MSSGLTSFFSSASLDQLAPWRGASSTGTNVVGNIFAPGAYSAVGDYTTRQEEIASETAANEVQAKVQAEAEVQAKAAATAAAAEAAAATEKAASDKKLKDAAEAEAEKLRKRKGYASTILTGADQSQMTTAPTQKAELLG